MRDFAALRGVTPRAVRYWLTQGLPAASRNPVRLLGSEAARWADQHTTPDSPYSHGGRRAAEAEKTPAEPSAARPGGAGADRGVQIDLSERGLEAAIADGSLSARGLDMMREALKVRAALRADAVSRGTLLRADEVERVWASTLTRLRAALDTLPGRTAARLQTELSLRTSIVPATRRVIEEELLAVLAGVVSGVLPGPAPQRPTPLPTT